MAGTAVDWNVAAIANTKGQIWADLAIPAGGARLSLHTDGTPDATANPNAKHLGMTREGAKFLVKPKYDQYYADEFLGAIKTNLSEQEMMITAELLQIMDMDLLELLTPGFGTKTTGSGYEQLTFGQKAISYSSVAVIFPTEADPTKFAVFQLYKAINEAGIDSGVRRKTLSGLPVSFRGYDITSRAIEDLSGSFWKQVAV